MQLNNPYRSPQLRPKIFPWKKNIVKKLAPQCAACRRYIACLVAKFTITNVIPP